MSGSASDGNVEIEHRMVHTMSLGAAGKLKGAKILLGLPQRRRDRNFNDSDVGGGERR